MLATTTVALILAVNARFPTFIPNTSIPDNAPVVLLSAIADCESGGQQFNPNGSLVHDSVTGNHIGLFQESLPLHGAQATSMGWDIKTSEGNVAEALWLYHQQGTAPWLASKSCWQAPAALSTDLAMK